MFANNESGLLVEVDCHLLVCAASLRVGSFSFVVRTAADHRPKYLWHVSELNLAPSFQLGWLMCGQSFPVDKRAVRCAKIDYIQAAPSAEHLRGQ